jgi:hypothetical protein
MIVLLGDIVGFIVMLLVIWMYFPVLKWHYKEIRKYFRNEN